MTAMVLTAGLAAAPAAAAAAAAPGPIEPNTPQLAAGTEKDPQTGRGRINLVGQGQDVPAVLGVTNVGDAPVEGLVVHVRILNDLDFTKKYKNCWYSVDNNLESAWCEFDQTLAPGASLAVTGLGISTKPDAVAANISSIIHNWVSKKDADDLGGIEELAKGWAGLDTVPALGSESPLTLATPSGELVGIASPLGFVGVRLTTPPTGGPTATPTPDATPTRAAPTSPGNPGGEAGGLPVTGSGTAATAGIGGALLLIGAAAYLVTRRRRTRFTA